jgi:hypothetical protein
MLKAMFKRKLLLNWLLKNFFYKNNKLFVSFITIKLLLPIEGALRSVYLTTIFSSLLHLRQSQSSGAAGLDDRHAKQKHYLKSPF